MNLDFFGDPFDSAFGALSSLRGPMREEFQRKHAEAFMTKMRLENERQALENEAFRNLNEAERIRLAAELLKLQGQAGHSSFKPKPLHVVNG